MRSRIIIIFLIFLSIKAVAQPPETIYLGNVAKSGYADDESYGPFNIGFNFTFYGNSYSQFYINSNGQILFGSGSLAGDETSIPNAAAPNNYIAAFWDDLVIDSYGKILYTTIGAAPSRKLIVQFKNMGFYPSPPTLGTFSVILYETSNIVQVQYRLIVLSYSDKAHGGDATIGLENADGSAGIQYSYHNPAAVNSTSAISFTPVAGPSYTVNSNASYDGIYLTTNLSLPEPGIPDLVSPPLDAVVGSDPTFEWTSASNAASYKLYISTDPGLIGATVYSAGSELSYDITGLEYDETYYWGVFAQNATGTTWCEIKRFNTSSPPVPLNAVPQTIWTEQPLDKTIKLNYTGGDGSPVTAYITSLPAQGALYQYNGGTRGSQITSVPTAVSDPGMNVIYAATGSSGNGVGNFNFMVHDDSWDSPEATITVNVSPPGIPNVLYVAKGANVEIQFDLTMSDPTGKQGQFVVKVNDSPSTISSSTLKTGDPYTIVLTLATPLSGGETVLVSYTQGDVTSTSGGYLLSFTEIPVTLTAQTITFTQSLDKKYSDSPFVLVSSASSGLGMTYSSSNLAVATITNNIATFHALGTSNITARQLGNVTYAPARYVKTLTVAKGDQTITFGALPTLYTGDPDYNPGATASSGLTVTYSSDNPSVATIVGGLIHIVGVGTTEITASQAGNTNYNPAPDVPQTLTVDTPTGVEDPLYSKTPFKIYTSGSILKIETLSSDWDGKTGTARMVDITGKQVLSIQNTEFWKNSPVQAEAPAVKGIYIVELRSGVMRFVGKVVVR